MIKGIASADVKGWFPDTLVERGYPHDIAALNLHCALGLPGSENVDIPACLRTLDDWAATIAHGTRRMMPKFSANPEEYNGSESYFRILIMVTVLQRNLGVRYNPECMTGPVDCTDPSNLFIHGVLQGHQGTCASLPVLYVALGRRLGYPLRLVGAKQHLFARWDDPGGERFNIECTSQGLLCHPDEYYHRWPVPLTAVDLDRGYYLNSFSPSEELACFLAARGHCLRDHLRLPEALHAFESARQLAPQDPNYQGFWAIAAVLHKHLAGLVNYRLEEGDVTGVRDKDKPRPLEPWEAWAIPHARRELRRIRALHRNVDSSQGTLRPS
jgi:hypothetical protein